MIYLQIKKYISPWIFSIAICKLVKREMPLRYKDAGLEGINDSD